MEFWCPFPTEAWRLWSRSEHESGPGVCVQLRHSAGENRREAELQFGHAEFFEEGVYWAVVKACDLLLERMEPVKKTRWAIHRGKELAKKCAAEFVYFPVTYLSDPELGSYEVYCVAAAEVELDVLTGLHQIVRVDLLEETGEVLSPQIDIGQVEGALL